MRKLMLALALVAVAAHAQPSDPKLLVRQGIALFDAGKIDEAIAKYKAAIAINPELAVAHYELALAYTVKQDYANCRAVLEPVLEKSGAELPTLYEALGNCYDGAGERAKAIAAYRKGLEVAPDSPHIAYNLAISLTANGELDEARELLKQDLIAVPNHVSARYALGRVFEAQNFRVPALLEYLRFLILEPDTQRSADAATRARTLLDLGVEKKGRKNINITVDPNSRKEEGDFSTMEMMLGLASGARFLDDKKKMSELEQLQDQISTVLSMILEVEQQDTYTHNTNVPLFATLKDKKLLDAYVASAFATLKPGGLAAWTKKNAADVKRYAELRDGMLLPPPAAIVEPR